MRRCGCDLGITPGSVEPFLRDRWIVVEMDQIMRDPRVPWFSLEDPFQYRGSPELIGVSLVVGRRRNVQRDRVADLCFVVVGIALGQPFHGLEMGLNAP